MEPVQPLETPTPALDTDVLAVVPSDATASEVATPAAPTWHAEPGTGRTTGAPAAAARSNSPAS